MKTLLIATDFSPNAKHAAVYGYQLALGLKANIILCNTFMVPAEIPEAELMTWPEMEYDQLSQSCVNELEELRVAIKTGRKAGFEPEVDCSNRVGSVTEVMTAVAKENKAGMIIMGSHGQGELTTLLLGNHTRMMIDNTPCPLLIVPASTPIKPVKKIAFATDFKNPDRDLEAIYKLVALIRPLNADLLITHILHGKHSAGNVEKWLQDMLVEISNKADYPHIYFRIVEGKTPEHGLDWLCDHGQVDILAMVHRDLSFFSRLFKSSYTQKMARRINIPLMVIPEHWKGNQ